MFDLFSFWATVSLLSLPALIVFVCLAAMLLISLLKSASRGRFNPQSTIREIQEDKRFGLTFMAGVIQLVAMTVVYLFHGTTPVAIVTKISTMLAPVGGWVSIVGISYLLFFCTARFVFDKVYSLEDRIAKTEKQLNDEE